MGNTSRTSFVFHFRFMLLECLDYRISLFPWLQLLNGAAPCCSQTTQPVGADGQQGGGGWSSHAASGTPVSHTASKQPDEIFIRREQREKKPDKTKEKDTKCRGVNKYSRVSSTFSTNWTALHLESLVQAVKCPTWTWNDSLLSRKAPFFYWRLHVRWCNTKGQNNQSQAQQNGTEVVLTGCTWIDAMPRSPAVDHYSQSQL